MTKRKRYFEARSAEGISSLGLCIGYDVSADVIASWDAAKRQEFEIYAERVHLKASDNPVQVPPRPSWLPDPWQGADDDWGKGPTIIHDQAAHGGEHGSR